jgi:hypothetical protein
LDFNLKYIILELILSMSNPARKLTSGARNDCETELSSESIMVIPDKQKYRRNDEKLPLATAVHYNWFLSLVFAIIVGQLSFHKANSFYFCNTLQKSLLIPTYSIWVVAEIPRLYAGQKGILCDKVRSKCL